ncbi:MULTISPECIES: helix-turn-helix transcriptional regulator [unclassified Caballeronia]|uniref:helix-turn-helix domain-containing protein n=1 Tax=unclassified Caballeronia TaxID=2646786 RepID=UPI00286038BD|nr:MULTISPECIES: helix-turn-helix transcriptional regulator [unclassified Caballeronia]MDR5771155.1 helix-turn-helix transcriptional regulator [Caballeronia sp. LZ002]MDR5801521.1 helix-turn-helix transcriptional regulator [Caballeronia sp. LZ001]MDR5846592.1 helix-turn-helix transcriptional regulator [Caballeronia sp. LZ003]
MRSKIEAFRIRLRRVRIELGESQRKFAARGGVTEKTQSNYENGSREPNLLYLYNLGISGINLSYLLTGEEFESQLHPNEQHLIRELRKHDCEKRDKLLSAVLAMLSASRL